jgi:hypothetical protein
MEACISLVAAGVATGVIVSPDRRSANVIDNVVLTARAAHEAGVRQVWLPQNFDYDALALAALVGLAVPGLGVGTSVVPINPRHPLIIAAGAQTAQAASHGNFSLGLGLGAPSIEQKAFGISPANTVQRLREHLLVLRSIQQNGTVDFHGEELTAVDPGVMPVSLALAGGTPTPGWQDWGRRCDFVYRSATAKTQGSTSIGRPRLIANFLSSAPLGFPPKRTRSCSHCSRRSPESVGRRKNRRRLRNSRRRLLRGHGAGERLRSRLRRAAGEMMDNSSYPCFVGDRVLTLCGDRPGSA